MRYTALAPWFGGKRTLAPRIVAELGPHRTYWEPFCGSLAVLLAKPRCSTETVNDLHRDLINLARVIRHQDLGPKLYRRLRRVLVCQTLLEEARGDLHGSDLDADPLPNVDRAEAFFVNSWLSMSGTAGTHEAFGTRRGIARRFSSLGGAPGIRFAAAVRSIPAWRNRMSQVMILNDDGLTLCEKIEDRSGTVIYADPPYLVKGGSYLHDFDSEDHARLAEVLRRFRRTRVVVSYYAHERLADLYPGWTAIACPVVKALVNQGRRDQSGRVEAPEVLLVNGSSLSGGLFAHHP